jgi:GNAT superfamily N-acetyltransferase
VDLAERLARHDLALRRITPDDEPFLITLYAGTREEELQRTPWSAAQKDAFVRMQFVAQHQHYQKHYARASYDIVMRRGVPIGRLYVDRDGEDILLIDIVLAPGARGAGIGTEVVRALQEEAREAGKPLALYVEKFNRARTLYDRLGFMPIDEGEVYWFMRWTPRPLSTEGPRE